MPSPAGAPRRRATAARPPGPGTDGEAADAFSALADPHRRRIVELLAGGARSVGELAGELPISRPAVSRHLRLLKEAGLVEDRPEGTRRLYRLDEAGAAAARRYLEEVWGEATARFRLVADNRGAGRSQATP